MEAKCRLLLKVQCVDEVALAKQIHMQAQENGWPGLGKEVRAICQQIQILDINKYKIMKQEIKDAIFNSHYLDMMSQFEGSKKLKDIKDDDFMEIQPLFKDTNIRGGRRHTISNFPIFSNCKLILSQI